MLIVSILLSLWEQGKIRDVYEKVRKSESQGQNVAEDAPWCCVLSSPLLQNTPPPCRLIQEFSDLQPSCVNTKYQGERMLTSRHCRHSSFFLMSIKWNLNCKTTTAKRVGNLSVFP